MNLEKYIEKLEVEKDFNLSQLTSFDKATKLQRTMNSKKKGAPPWCIYMFGGLQNIYHFLRRKVDAIPFAKRTRTIH